MISLALTSAQAGFLAEVIDQWLERMADVIDFQDDPSDVEFLIFIHDLRSRLTELTEDPR